MVVTEVYRFAIFAGPFTLINQYKAALSCVINPHFSNDNLSLRVMCILIMQVLGFDIKHNHIPTINYILLRSGEIVAQRITSISI